MITISRATSPERSQEAGFTLTELLVSTTVMLLVTGAALTTFKNAINVNDSAAQIMDANQNLRAGTNQLIRDLMMAGRIIGSGGVALPSGGSAVAFNRPGPTVGMTFGNITTLSDITSGNQQGPTVDGKLTDLVTIMTVDEFMPMIQTPPAVPATPTTIEGTIAADGSSVTLPNTSLWLVGDPTNDTPAIVIGDLIYFQNPKGNAVQTVTRVDSTHIYFDQASSNDWFKFNQRGAAQVPILTMTPGATPTTLFRAMMITYYVDNTTTPGTPRLDRVLDNFTPQALAGVVESLALTYDLMDGTYNPTGITTLPWTDSVHNLTYQANQIRKVNVSVGVRSEVISKPAQDYIRNRIQTAVLVRSLAAVSKYPTS